MRREGLSLFKTVECDLNGFGQIDAMPVGKYLIRVTSGGSRPYFSQELEIQDAESFWPIELPLVEVKGRILLGDEPLPDALLIFGGATGSESTELTADKDGRFAGSLPRDGMWRVDVSAQTPRVERSLRKVEVKRRRGGAPAEVEIRLPNLVLSGTVADDQGRPPAKAIVQYRAHDVSEDIISILVRDDGKFEFAGLSPGSGTVRAETETAESDAFAITLIEDLDHPSVNLVVRERQRIKGIVVGSNGPAIRASVGIREAGGWLDRNAGADTGVDGRFEVSLPREVHVAHVYAASPGSAFHLGRYQVSSEADLDLRLSAEGGAVELHYAPDKWDWLYLIHDRASMFYGAAHAWATLHGAKIDIQSGIMVVPNLEGGSWHACLVERGTEDWIAVASLGFPVERQCRSFQISPQGFEVIDLATLQ